MSKRTYARVFPYALALAIALGLLPFSVIGQSQESGSSGKSGQSGQQSGQQSSDDSVAEAAKKAREKKKDAAAKGKKVYTNDDVSKTKSSDDAAGRTTEDKAKADAAGADKEGPGNNEEKWRKRFKDARDKLAQSEKELDILQREREKLLVQYYADPQKAMDQQYSRKDINDQDAKIEAKKKEIEDGKQHLSDLEDELRKSGGDPGWAREQ
jgi:chromosome segregation ATPase